MADIRVNQLPLATGPTAPMQSDVVPIDGTTTRKATLLSLADVINPPASQAEAEAAVDPTKRMTPLTTGQAIASLALTPSDVGTTAGTVAAGNDSRIVSAVQPLTTFSSRNRIVRGSGISDALWAARIGDFQNGQRAPHFIWNDPSPSDLVPGYNSGQQIWVGDNPVATPGAGHTAGSTIGVFNGRSRDALYGENILVGFANGGAGYNDGFLCGLEINVYSDFAGTVTDAYGGGNRKNGLELTSQGSVGRVTAAAMVWSADSTGAAWWTEGLAISRSVDYGIRFARNAGSTDGINAFQQAAIFDNSASVNVLRVGGSHESLLTLQDNPTLTNFVRGRTSANTSLLFKNYADFHFDLTIDSGSSTVRNSSVVFSDRGSVKWQIVKNAGNGLFIVDSTAGISAMFFDGNTVDAVNIRVNNSDRRIQAGAADSAGAGFRTLRIAN